MPRSQPSPVAETARAAAVLLQRLDPGRLAELRRMRAPSAGVPAYWRLAAQHTHTIGNRHDEWMAILRILAVLTPKGDPENRPSLHDPGRRLGAMLCDGGDPDWRPIGDSIRPAISERRLAQLMASRGRQRQVLLERAVRAIARTRRPDYGVNVVDIAWWLLDGDPVRASRRLAESYYRRRDRIERDEQSTEQGANI